MQLSAHLLSHLLQRADHATLCCLYASHPPYTFCCRLLQLLPLLLLPSPEWNIIYDKLAKCAASGAQIVLSRLAIGDLGTQYFADRGIFCAGRVPEDDLQRMAKATGGWLQLYLFTLPVGSYGSSMTQWPAVAQPALVCRRWCSRCGAVRMCKRAGGASIARTYAPVQLCISSCWRKSCMQPKCYRRAYWLPAALLLQH
jgi:hypothetical protein